MIVITVFVAANLAASAEVAEGYGGWIRLRILTCFNCHYRSLKGCGYRKLLLPK